MNDEQKCMDCDATLTKIELEMFDGCCTVCTTAELEEDFLTGKTCNPDAPEECESCQ